MRTILDAIRHDGRLALRQIQRYPGSYGVILLTLALGLGAGAAILSIANAVLMRPPFPGAARMVVLRDVQPPGDAVVASYPEYLDWKARTQIFDGVGAVFFRAANLTAADGVERVGTIEASAEVLRLAGVTPVLGRAHTAAEDVPGAASVVLISDELWARRFGRSPQAVGSTLELNEKSVTVIGVLPPNFQFLYQFDVWLPLGLDEASSPRGAHLLTVVATPRRDVGLEGAGLALETAATNLQKERGTDHSIRMTPFSTVRAGNGRDTALLLLAAVACLGLIGCANVASLLLARGTARRGELAVRRALGASRGRLVGQLLTESVLLGLAGGGTGLLIAQVSLRLVEKLGAPFLPFGATLVLDARVVTTVLALGLLSGLLFGLLPAFQAARGTEGTALASVGRGAVGGRAGARHALVIVDFALAVVLLVGASLLGRSLLRMMSDPRGFDEARVVTFRVSLTGPRYEEPAPRMRFFRDGVATLRQAGFESVGAISNLPLDGAGVNGDLGVEGRDSVPSVNMRIVDTDYFRALGIPLLRGRFFTDTDTTAAPGVALVNAALAERLWPGQNPLGKRVAFQWEMEGFQEVVGVVGDVRQESPTMPVRPEVYVSLNQRPPASMSIVVRGSASTTVETVTTAAKRAFGGIDSTQALYGFQTMERVVDRSVSSPRAAAFLVSLFAGLALALSVIGIAGVMASLVGQRRREIGVRMAMGAGRADVLRLVMGEGLRWALGGVVAGLALAVILSPLLRSAVFGISAGDPLTYIGAAGILLTAAAAAILGPATRAARLDPNAALRQE